jgi:hypothetical protein
MSSSTSVRRNRGNMFLVTLVLGLAIVMGASQSSQACCWCGYGGYYGGGYGGYGGGYGGYGGGYGGYGWGYPHHAYMGYGGYGYPSYGYGYGSGWSYPSYAYGYTGYGDPYSYEGYTYPYSYGGYSYPYSTATYVYPSSVYSYGSGYPGYTSSYPATTGGFTYSPAYVAPGGSDSNMPGQGQVSLEPGLGVDIQEAVEPNGQRVTRVTKVYPDTPAAKAGMQEGDSIRSANGYLTQVPGNLTWIIENAASDRALRMAVVSQDGRERTVTANLPR